MIGFEPMSSGNENDHSRLRCKCLFNRLIYAHSLIYLAANVPLLLNEFGSFGSNGVNYVAGQPATVGCLSIFSTAHPFRQSAVPPNASLEPFQN